MTFTVRTIGEGDYDAVNALHRSVGWPRRSAAGWLWLHNNPARIESGAPAGWLLTADDDGEACGMVGNFVQRFRRNEEVLYGASGFSIVVTKRARGQSRRLLRLFADQPNMFARFTFNANPTSSPLYKRYDMVAWPETTHALKLSWRVDTLACAGGRLWREIDKRAPRFVDPSHERLMNNRLVDPDRLDLPQGVAVLTDFADKSRYADFWTALTGEGRLITDRSPSVMRWRLSDPDLTLRPLILAFNQGKTIGGVAMAMVSKGNPIEPPMLEIIDLVALRDQPRAIPALMEALLKNARMLGAAKVRIQTVNDDLLRRLGPLAASAKQEGGWGHCHVRFEPGMEGLSTWAPTPFDGDYGICLRPVPVGTAEAKAA